MTMLSRLKRDLTMADTARVPGGSRVDLVLVSEMVAPGAKVLAIAREGVNECVAKGLAVIQEIGRAHV